MNKKDIQGFQEVMKYLNEKQTGSFGIGRLNRYEMRVLKYVGIGEGMEYETMEDYDYKDLIEVLNNEVQNEI